VAPEAKTVSTDGFEKLRYLLLPSSYSQDPYTRFYNALRKYGIGRRLCTTSTHQVALVPEESRVGDVLCFLHGTSLPQVLRKEGDQHILIGEACKLGFPVVVKYNTK
jgi:hypothetical protein